MFGSCRCSVLSEGKAVRNTASKGSSVSTAEPSDIVTPHGDKGSFSEREKALPNIRSVTFKLLCKGLSIAIWASNCSLPVDLWWVNSNAWLLSETIGRHAKAFTVVNWYLSRAGSVTEK